MSFSPAVDGTKSRRRHFLRASGPPYVEIAAPGSRGRPRKAAGERGPPFLITAEPAPTDVSVRDDLEEPTGVAMHCYDSRPPISPSPCSAGYLGRSRRARRLRPCRFGRSLAYRAHRSVLGPSCRL